MLTSSNDRIIAMKMFAIVYLVSNELIQNKQNTSTVTRDKTQRSADAHTTQRQRPRRDFVRLRETQKLARATDGSSNGAPATCIT